MMWVGAVWAALAFPTPALAAELTTFHHGFDTGLEGWTLQDNGGTGTSDFFHFGSGGNPGGYVHVYDNVDNASWSLNSPPAWAGDREANYGGTFSFHFRWAPPICAPGPGCPPPPNAQVLVALETAGQGRLERAFSNPPQGGSSWAFYSIPLSPAGAWSFCQMPSPCGTASEAQIRSVLANLATARIFGDVFQQYSDTGSVDNVRLTEPDDDGDGVGNAADQCPGEGAATPSGCPDADGDGVVDRNDRCPSVAAGGRADGCPRISRRLTIFYAGAAFRGRVRPAGSCARRQRVRVFEVRRGRDPLVGADTTDAAGHYAVRERNVSGRYYAKVLPSLSPSLGRCKAARSPIRRFR